MEMRPRFRWTQSAEARSRIDEKMRSYYEQSAAYHTDIGDIAGIRPSGEERDLFDAIITAVGANDGARVLELGAGRAESVHYLLDRLPGASYVGIDASPSAVAKARAAHPSYDMRAADITELPFGGGVFDVCFFNYVLEHTAFPHRVLAEALRVVRPGGVVAMIVPTTDLPWLLASSERHKRGQVPFVLRRTIQRAIDMLLTRHVRSYYSFRLVEEPLVLEPIGAFEPDDDQVYWSSSFEIAKWLGCHGAEIEWAGRRDITSCIENGRRPAVDTLRRAAFAAWRAAMREPRRDAFTTTVSLVARKSA